MSLPSPQTAAADLDPAILEPLLDMIMDASPALPNETEQDRATRRNVARLAVLALRPTDPFQAMLAAQTVAAHYAIMDAFRRAAPLDVPDNVAARLRSNAVSLTRTMHATMRRLREQQGLIAPKPAATPTHPAQPAPTPPSRPTPMPVVRTGGPAAPRWEKGQRSAAVIPGKTPSAPAERVAIPARTA